MSWATPALVEICIGLEINGYLPAEFWISILASGDQSPSAPSRRAFQRRSPGQGRL